MKSHRQRHLYSVERFSPSFTVPTHIMISYFRLLVARTRNDPKHLTELPVVETRRTVCEHLAELLIVETLIMMSHTNAIQMHLHRLKAINCNRASEHDLVWQRRVGDTILAHKSNRRALNTGLLSLNGRCIDARSEA